MTAEPATGPSVDPLQRSIVGGSAIVSILEEASSTSVADTAQKIADVISAGKVPSSDLAELAQSTGTRARDFLYQNSTEEELAPVAAFAMGWLTVSVAASQILVAEASDNRTFVPMNKYDDIVVYAGADALHMHRAKNNAVRDQLLDIALLAQDGMELCEPPESGE